MIVLHHTTAGRASVEREFMRPEAKKSAHNGVWRDGSETQFVDPANIAWHAMQANRSSIGIECEAIKAGDGLTPAQEATLVARIQDYMQRYPSITRICGHGEVNATACPSFIWKAPADLAAWVKAKGL